MEKRTIGCLVIASLIILGCVLFPLFPLLFYGAVGSVIYDDPKEAIVKACEQKDFEKAYQLMNSNDAEFYYGSGNELKLYIFEKETDYLLDQNEEFASKKIVFLFRELIGKKSLNKKPDYGYEGNLKEVCASLMGKAITMKNTFLIKELANADDFYFQECINYLCEEGNENDLIDAKDMVIKRAKKLDFIYDNNGTEKEDLEKTKYGYDEVFNACIKKSAFPIAKELINHLLFLKEKTINISDSLNNSSEKYIEALQRAYSVSINKDSDSGFSVLNKNGNSKRLR